MFRLGGGGLYSMRAFRLSNIFFSSFQFHARRMGNDLQTLPRHVLSKQSYSMYNMVDRSVGHSMQQVIRVTVQLSLLWWIITLPLQNIKDDVMGHRWKRKHDVRSGRRHGQNISKSVSPGVYESQQAYLELQYFLMLSEIKGILHQSVVSSLIRSKIMTNKMTNSVCIVSLIFFVWNENDTVAVSSFITTK
jgi:hypothetical protein